MIELPENPSREDLQKAALRLRTNEVSNELSGRILRWLSDDLRYRIEDLAGAMGISTSYAYRIKSGQRSLNLGQLERLADRLGIPMPIMMWRASKPDELPANETVAKLHQELENSLRRLYEQHFTYAESLLRDSNEERKP